MLKNDSRFTKSAEKGKGWFAFSIFCLISVIFIIASDYFEIMASVSLAMASSSFVGIT